MRGSGDMSLANLPEPRSVEEVAAINLAVDKAAERRYLAVARDLGRVGSPAVVALLKDLAGEHGARAGQLEAEVAAGKRLDLGAQDLARLLPRSLSDEGAAACDLLGLTPYRVLAFAVSLAQHTFELYSYLAATADRDVCDYAERLAGAELSRAARLRVERRRAYHGGGRQAEAEAYPGAHLVESEADLLAAALAIEARLAQSFAVVGEDETGVSSTRQATRQRVEHLRRAAEEAGEPGGPMAEELAVFSRSTQTTAKSGGDREAARRHLLAECDRAFTFYDAVARAAVSEAVLLQAQDLSQAAVERIRQVRAASNAPDETDRRTGNR